jgi:hypothetical protein
MFANDLGDTMHPEGYILLPPLSQTQFVDPMPRARSCRCRKERDYPPVLTSIVQAQMDAIKLQRELRLASPIAYSPTFHITTFSGG